MFKKIHFLEFMFKKIQFFNFMFKNDTFSDSLFNLDENWFLYDNWKQVFFRSTDLHLTLLSPKTTLLSPKTTLLSPKTNHHFFLHLRCKYTPTDVHQSRPGQKQLYQFIVSQFLSRGNKFTATLYHF